MKTILGTEIPRSTRGILYLCTFYFSEVTKKYILLVNKELFFDKAWEALEAYANIPNPESQLVTARTYEGLIYELELLHKNMKDKVWLENLANCL